MKTTIAFLLLLCFSPLFSQKLSKREFNRKFQNADIIFEESFDTLFRDVELNETDNPDYIDEAILRRYAKG